MYMLTLPRKMQNNEVLKPAKYFSELEKNVLLALVEKYKYVLECKKSDARTIALKQRTWQALAHEYNSQPSVSLRDFKQLKKCWENIKARTRKIMAHERREKVMRCGLGSSSIKEKVASMIPDQIYYVQTPSEEESTYNHETSTTGLEMDSKKVNLLDLELLIDEQGKIQTKQYNKPPETESLCGEGSPSSSVEKGEKRLGGHPSSKENRDPPPREEGEIPSTQAEQEEEENVVELVTTTGDRDVVDPDPFTSESAQILIGEIMGCNLELENLKKNINDVIQKTKNIIDVLG
ncbi:myb/SANT-like DNA-binding domain-containing protein 3 isoform X4 [Aquarana catesbeiana]|uniref:myb/SANT-like DNA-binding domain-containing protein 3 isoform X4 n=1 Tax=Aquarana catesbeiana TaxID=8400 RepID=UPI003CC9A678